MKKVRNFIIKYRDKLKEDKLSYYSVKYTFVAMFVIALLLLLTYAYYLVQITGTGKILSGKAAFVDITVVDTADVNVTTAAPIHDSMKATDSHKNTFTVSNLSTNGSTVPAEYEVYLNLTSLPTALKSQYMKYEVLVDNTAISSGNFSNFVVGDNLLTPTKQVVALGGTRNVEVRIWMSYHASVDQTAMLNKSLSGKVKIKANELPPFKPSNCTASSTKLNCKTLANNPPTTYTTTPGREVSETDEGLIEGSNDDYGAKTYYFRGTAPDNYVTFAGKTWRVVRINGDGSVRLVLNTTTGTNSAWNTNYISTTWSTALSYATYTNSTIKTAVETWYNTNIGNNTNYSSKVVESKFCNDRTYTTSSAYYYFGARNRLYPASSAEPSYICPDSTHIYNLNVGLLTSDEVAFAGGAYGTTNQSYYLYKSGTSWWTLSPHDWNVSTGGVTAWFVYYGILNTSNLNNSYGVVPVISLSSEVTVSTASSTNRGTSTNPYIVQ